MSTATDTQQQQQQQRISPSTSATQLTEGGNYESVSDYVAKRGGNKVIDTVLIANNGIAAVKCIRSMRKWAYETFGNEKAIQFVVMATPEDLRVNAEYIRMADQIEEVPGGSNANNYANVDLIVEIAERRGVQAVWAGWGHASENPRLPEKLGKTKTKIAFIGPPSKAMHDLGDKIASTLIAQSANVNCVAWSGSGVTLNYSEEGIPEAVYAKATVSTLEEALESIKKIGYPAMIKASEGGGGKGIRKVTSESEVEAAFRQVQGEVPGSPIFIMQMLSRCRHLEVQVLADQYGEAIALYGRDCSVQRRHQKIIEEGPAIIAPEDIRLTMEQAATRMTKEVGYQGVGTVEYLYSPERNEYYFLELNPRLQVEHPVTELITDVNLPAAQLNVAMGIPLNQIPDIRRLYNHDPATNTVFDFATTPRRPPRGHVVACRITGENPAEGFKPTSGGIQELTFRSTAKVWGYFSVGALGGLHEFADSQFGHIFSHGDDREKARKEMVIALKELSIRGDISTPVAYVSYLIETQVFKDNQFNTHWLDSLIAEAVEVEKKPDEWLVVFCGALYKAFHLGTNRADQYVAFLGRGQIPPKDLLRVDDTLDLIYNNTKYSFRALRTGPNSLLLELVGQPERRVEAEIRPLGDGGCLILLDGRSHLCYGTETPSGLKLILEGRTVVQFTSEYDPTKLKTSTAGKLVRYLVDSGSHVKAGAAYAEIEVMKMYLPLVAAESGRITFLKTEGSVLGAGTTVATLELDDPSQVRKTKIFEGQLPLVKAPYVKGEKVHQVLRDALLHIQRVLAGYFNPDIPGTISTLLRQLANPELPLLEFQECLSRISAKLPKPLVDQITSELKIYKNSLENPSTASPFQGATLLTIIERYAQSLQSTARQNELMLVAGPLVELSQKFRDGLHQHTEQTIINVLQEFLNVESHFQVARDDVLTKLRVEHKGDLRKVFENELSHHNLSAKTKLVTTLLEHLPTLPLTPYLPYITHMSELSGADQNAISHTCRRMLIINRLPSFQQRYSWMEDELKSREKVDSLITKQEAIFDVLTALFYNEKDPSVSMTATEVYIKRSYRSYDIQEVSVSKAPFSADHHDIIKAEWSYIPPFGWDADQSSSSSSTSSDPTLGGSPSLTGPHSSMMSRMPRIDTDDNLFAREQSALRHSGSSSSSPSIYANSSLNSNNNNNQNGEDASTQYGRFYLIHEDKDVFGLFPSILEDLNKTLPLTSDRFTNVLKIAVLQQQSSSSTWLENDESSIARLSSFLQEYTTDLRKLRIRRITFMVVEYGKFPKYYSFRERLNYHEHPIYRHIEPPMAYHLELRRLSNYNIQLYPCDNHQIHLYYGEEKRDPIIPGLTTSSSQQQQPRRVAGPPHACFFARAVLRTGYTPSTIPQQESPEETLIAEAESVLSEALNALEIAMSLPNFKSRTWNNHIFMKFVPEVSFNPDRIVNIITGLARKYSRRFGRCQVGEVELVGKLRRPDPRDKASTVRFVINNPTTYRFNIDAYIEYSDLKARKVLLKPLFGSKRLANKEITDPYPLPTPIQFKRTIAHANNTTYCYDFIDLFEESLQIIWERYVSERRDAGMPFVDIPERKVFATELVMTSSPLSSQQQQQLVAVEREPGLNDVGMVAWRIKLLTPEYPQGRDIILIANDITFQSGSFGVPEDLVFKRASELARAEKIPRIYIAANSGARIGLATEVQEKYHVEWVDPEVPQKGFKYLYVTEEDYQILSRLGSVHATKVDDNRYMIHDIIGAKDGLGVENLRGSGMIAGETSLAYDETFTLTFVTGRTVGIGAYLVRLGQRTIQDRGPIILTGASALNKVLGRSVYSSNVQLGGTQVMYANGVSHLVVSDPLEGSSAILNWLSFIPRAQGQPLPVVDPVDPIDRTIDFIPTKAPYDPRHMIGGVYQSTLSSTPAAAAAAAVDSSSSSANNDLDNNNNNDHSGEEWLSGFFDKGSFIETLGGWAKTVVTGRARLGGIPMGIIAVETRTVEVVKPADPAALESHEDVIPQAGQVWFPDSAYKTAQAIKDFNKGEGLPLIIFANWRGFSGGLRDLYQEILKFGSYIVDNLREYKQPVFSYIPPGGELRGGAWVVVDPTINLDMMEMYSDPQARGGILEPHGTVEIKYKAGDLIKTMHRLDPKLKEWDSSLLSLSSSSSQEQEQESTTIRGWIKAREKELMSTYERISVTFADLQDTPGRMKAKGVIREIVPWQQAREFFYYRLKRRLEEESLKNRIVQQVHNNSEREEYRSNEARGLLIRNWIKQSLPQPQQEEFDSLWEDDKFVIQWFESQKDLIEHNLKSLRASVITQQIQNIALENPIAAIEGFTQLLRSLTAEQRASLNLDSIRGLLS